MKVLFIIYLIWKGLCHDNFKFDENGSKLSKQVENAVGKGKIAHYEQFLLFPQCFQKACFPGASKGVIVWEWVKANKYRKSGDQHLKNSKEWLVSYRSSC